MKQLVFIDDSGDPGFVRGASSSKLIMAGAIFIDPEEATKLNNEISKFRKSFGWRDNHEFKFSKTNKEIRTSFLKIASKYNFDIYVVYINKKYSLNASRFINNEQLYNWATKELLKIMPLNNAYVKIDGRANKKYSLKVATYIRKEINTKTYKIKKIETADSIKDNLIQLADMIVGSIGRSFQTDKTDAKTYIKIIKNKIVKVKPLNLEQK